MTGFSTNNKPVTDKEADEFLTLHSQERQPCRSAGGLADKLSRHLHSGLSGGTIDMGESRRRKERKEVVEVFRFLDVLLQYVGDVFVNVAEAGLRCPALDLLVELVVELNLVHDFGPLAPNGS